MNTFHRPPLWLLTLLIMFPQLVETIYSPALPGIATSYHVSSERAAQTLSVYFVAFAVGVAMWGWLDSCATPRVPSWPLLPLISAFCCWHGWSRPLELLPDL